jgi:hypothetical protein
MFTVGARVGMKSRGEVAVNRLQAANVIHIEAKPGSRYFST